MIMGCDTAFFLKDFQHENNLDKKIDLTHPSNALNNLYKKFNLRQHHRSDVRKRHGGEI